MGILPVNNGGQRNKNEKGKINWATQEFILTRTLLCFSSAIRFLVKVQFT